MASLRRVLWLEDSHCHYCNLDLPWNCATRDHIVPKWRGLPEREYAPGAPWRCPVPDNDVIACTECNQAKGMIDYEDFIGSAWLARRIEAVAAGRVTPTKVLYTRAEQEERARANRERRASVEHDDSYSPPLGPLYLLAACAPL